MDATAKRVRRRARLRRAVLALLAGVLAAAALAGWVLESGGVAVVETRRPDGGLRRTRVWYAVAGERIWLEAGRPEHPWYLDVQRAPRLRFVADGVDARFDAATVPGRDAHAHVRALLREKYGLRDRILAAVLDTSQSVAVILTRVGDDEAAERVPAPRE